MKHLRTVSTRRLLALIAASLVIVGGGTAIAGITARVTFANHLIDSSSIQGSDPIISGASGRLWLDPVNHRLRLELQSDHGDAQVVVNNGSFWVYDPMANTVYRGKVPADGAKMGTGARSKPADHALPTVAAIESDLNRLMGHANVSGAIPSDVAGEPAYTVRISPKHDGGLLA